MKKISIIVPVYNVEKYLIKCIHSLLNQSYSNYEIIFVNDGSTDGSQNIIDNYARKYPNIIRSYIKENGGQGSARNLGLQKAQGEYICFVDSDDYVEKNFLKDICNFIQKNDFDIVIFDSYKIFNDGNKKEYLEGLNKLSDDIKINYILSSAGPCNKIYKKSLWVDNNIKFMEKIIYEDLAVIPTLAKYTNKIGYLKKPLYNYLIHGESSTNHIKYSIKMRDMFKALKNLDKELEKEFFKELEYLYIVNLLHGSGLRFLNFSEGIEDIKKISYTMKSKFPKWYRNKYYKKKSFKYKIICYLLYKNKFRILKKISK